MRTLLLTLALVLCGPAAAQSGELLSPPLPEPEASEEQPALPEELPAPSLPPGTARNRLPDQTAEVLQPGEGQFNLFYLQYSRGLLPGLQLSAQLGAYLLTLVNLTAEYQIVDRDELRASVELGAYWFALSPVLAINALQVHLTPRVTVPLGGDFELNLAPTLRAQVLALPGLSQNVRDLRGEVSLIRYDPFGAWMLQGRFPLLTQQTLHVDELLGQANVTGSLLLDDLDSWGVVLFRDQLIGDTAHLRFGLGYRRRPGLLLADSLGNLILQFDLYWR